jgi:NAD(P)-dependent dehydrogenase (short-subunit alcohol dehydrogenase family)
MIDVDAADSAMQVNFWSAVRLAKALMRPMMQARGGRIVLIGSVTATRGNQGNAVYAATKAALLGYAKTLATEIARRGVTVNYVAPGYVDTDMLARYAAFREMLEKQIPAQRYAKPEDLAAVVSFLMSDGAAYVNGAEIAVDGALSASLGIKR